MKSAIGWIVALVLGLSLVLILGVSVLFGGRYGMMGGYGMMGPGYGYLFPFGWIGMLFWMIVPIGLLILLVAGGVWLVGRLTYTNRSTTLPPESTLSRTCPHCGKPVQGDWKNCPYCGNPLS